MDSKKTLIIVAIVGVSLWLLLGIIVLFVIGFFGYYNKAGIFDVDRNNGNTHYENQDDEEYDLLYDTSESSDNELSEPTETKPSMEGNDADDTVKLPDNNSGDDTKENTDDRNDKPVTTDKPCKKDKHTYGKSVVVREATCKKKGISKRVCTLCGYTDEQEIKRSDHIEKRVKAVEATCTKDGKGEYKICSVCDEILTTPKTIKKLGHDMVEVPAKAATCTETGLTKGEKCSRCGKVSVEQQVQEKIPHKEITVHGKVATCAEYGLTEGKKCSVCNTVTKAQNSIPKLNHKYTSWVAYVDATCSTSGYGIRKCGDCGFEETLTIPTTGRHSYLNGKCSDCGYYVPGTAGLTFRLSDDGTYYICTGIDDYFPPSTITIPAYHNGKPVKEIAGNGFVDITGKYIKNIIISDGIEKIGRMVIYCAGIESITIPDSVRYIHGIAFRGCDNLETVYIGTTGWNFKGSSISFSDPYKTAQQLRKYNDGYAYTR